jgi:pyruvate, water dikinase
MDRTRWIAAFVNIGRDDVPRVGGKNASLGEMIATLRDAGVAVPDGFATTADAYREHLARANLGPEIEAALAAYQAGEHRLAETAARIRRRIEEVELPAEIAGDIRAGYRDLCRRFGAGGDVAVAVRSSATAEDLPEASFAGQQDSFLNVRGDDAVVAAVVRCFGSLFTERAMAYRERNGFDHFEVALSAGVQLMVGADRGAAGVIFTIDTETGFPDALLINAAWGLGETVVQGIVDPDEYVVFKPLVARDDLRPILHKRLGDKAQRMVLAEGPERTTRLEQTTADMQARYALTDDDILQLARWAARIEAHYGAPMDIEWAKDGDTGHLYIVQARPETVQSRKHVGALTRYRLGERGDMLAQGLAIGDAVAAGTTCVLLDPAQTSAFEDGCVLVTRMTDPDWVPLMRRAAAIVTEHGGRTSHAAIVSRELGLPAVVGTGDATRALGSGRDVTVSCAEGDTGFVYDGIAEFELIEGDAASFPETRTDIMLNIADPGASFRWWQLPSAGVGLARMEFIISHFIKVHPMALVRPTDVDDDDARAIRDLVRGYASGEEFFVERLAHGIARIAAPHYPRPVIVRMSDFKTNEYAELVGGRAFEPAEENPMLGWRGASRYYDDGYRDGFALECAAIRRVRERIGLDNVIVMIPFCRTPAEADRVLAEMASHGLVRGSRGLEIYVMCEIPSNVILARDFAERFDGFSIGSNDLTQLTLGIDRDSAKLADLFDEKNPAVVRSIERVVADAHAAGCKIGFCGQAPSNDPGYAELLVRAGIDSISISPDSFADVTEHVAAAESGMRKGRAAS